MKTQQKVAAVVLAVACALLARPTQAVPPDLKGDAIDAILSAELYGEMAAGCGDTTEGVCDDAVTYQACVTVNYNWVVANANPQPTQQQYYQINNYRSMGQSLLLGAVGKFGDAAAACLQGQNSLNSASASFSATPPDYASAIAHAENSCQAYLDALEYYDEAANLAAEAVLFLAAADEILAEFL